jgi:hypothetical protein
MVLVIVDDVACDDQEDELDDELVSLSRERERASSSQNS